MTDAARIARNRLEFPALAEIMDQVRQHIPGAKLIHGIEGGREIGKDPFLDAKPIAHFVDMAMSKIECRRRSA